VHDSRILRESELHKDLVAGRKKGLLIGDSICSLSSFLMKPLTAVTTVPQRRYQKRLLKARCLIEHAFGRLKRRFNCLHQELRYAPDRCCAIIAACFCLHNFTVLRQYPPFGEDEDIRYITDDNIEIIDDRLDGKEKQRQIIANFFNY
jgi:hypothetical protein